MLMAASHLRGSHHVSTQTLIVYPPQIDDHRRSPQTQRWWRLLTLNTSLQSAQPRRHLSLKQREAGGSMQHRAHGMYGV